MGASRGLSTDLPSTCWTGYVCALDMESRRGSNHCSSGYLDTLILFEHAFDIEGIEKWVRFR